MEHLSNWTEERTEQLKVLWAEGLSYSAIARKLGGGTTRCSVIGKIHRMGLSRGDGGSRLPNGYARKPVRRAKPKPAKPTPALFIPRVVPDQPKPLGAVRTSLARGLCQYIHGGLHEDWRMCGAETGRNAESWCPACRAVVFDKVRTVKANKSAQQREAERTMKRMGLG